MIKFEFNRNTGRIESVSFLILNDCRVLDNQKTIQCDNGEKLVATFLKKKNCEFHSHQNQTHDFDDYFWVHSKQNDGSYAYIGLSIDKATIIVSEYYDTHDAVRKFTTSPNYDYLYFHSYVESDSTALYTQHLVLDDLKDNGVVDKMVELKKAVGDNIGRNNNLKLKSLDDFKNLYCDVLECFKLTEYKYD